MQWQPSTTVAHRAPDPALWAKRSFWFPFGGRSARAGAKSSQTYTRVSLHDFDARLFVLEGSITLVFGADRCTFGPGDSCNVPAGTMHEEHTEADGVRYMAGRRPAAAAAQ